ncbi:MAG: hypothetical protein R3E64_09095 [Halioglobus sp.]
MDALLTIIALLLPILLGSAWLHLLVPAQTTARTTVVCSHGTLLGLMAIPLLMWAMNRAGLPLSFASTAAVASGLIALAALAGVLRRGKTRLTANAAAPHSSLSTAQRLLFILLCLLLLVRVTTLGLEILWRPLFPWDATMHWATKARVWYAFNDMRPFVDNIVWLNMGGNGVFTDRHPEYPAMIPLLQVWMNLATGRWDESLMNLPWLLCLIALGGAVYSQLRVSGVSAVVAIAGTYMLLSMPLLNIHVALAGYADLFLGAAYCSGLMAFYNWRASGQRWQGLLVICFALACPLIKNEGLLWSLTFIPALVFTIRTRHKMVKLIALCILGLALLWVLMIKNPVIVNQIVDLLTQFHPGGLTGIIKSIWLHDNWHLFGYLLLVMIPIGLFLKRTHTRAYLGVGIALACAVGLFLFMFLFTIFGIGASTFTGVGRLSIQLIPGLLFLTTLLANELLTSGVSRSATTLQANHAQAH